MNVLQQLDRRRASFAKSRPYGIRTSVVALLGVLLVGAALSPSASASTLATPSASWPQIGFGPARNADNLEEHTLTPSTVGSLRQIWRSPGASGILPALVVGNGLVYASYANSTPASAEGVRALSAATGASRWFYHFSPGSKYAPALDGTTLFVSASHGLIALNALTGKVLWTASAGGSLQAVASPLVAGTSVYLVAFSGTHVLRSYNAATGRLRWSLVVATDLAGPLAYKDGTLYLTTALGYRGGSLQVEAINASSGAVFWSQTVTDTPSWYRPFVSVGLGLVFVNGHKNVWALKSSNGSVAWHTAFPAGVYGTGTLALDVANNELIAPSTTRLLGLKATTGAVLFMVSEFADSSSIADGVIYNTSAATSEVNGTTLWSYPSGFQALDDDGIAITGGRLYVHGVNRTGTYDVYAFGLKQRA